MIGENLITGIVDIGSNTIRLNVYNINEENFELMLSKKVSAGLINYKKNKILNEQGIKILISTIQDFKKILDFLNIKNYHFFATASLRNIKNKDNVLKQVKDKTGISIELISGKEEAQLSFQGVVSSIKEKDGVLIDLGGGSTEIVIFEDSKSKLTFSLPIGSLSLFNKYVNHMLPTYEEAEDIREEVFHQLKVLKVPHLKIKNMVGVGGTIRAIKKLLISEGLQDESNNLIFSSLLKEVEKDLKHNDKKTYMKILKVKASRIHNLVPGLIVIDAISDYIGEREIQACKFGVREGYLNSKIINDSE